MERRLVKVLKGLAEYHDLSLGDLLEGIVLHAFERSCPFDEASVAVIDQLKGVYGLDLTAADSHQLISPERSTGDDMHTRPPDRDRGGGIATSGRVRALHPER